MTSRPVVVATALVGGPDELLMVRRGIGPAGGTWDLPAAVVGRSETMAEAVVRALEEECGFSSGLCGSFEGWQESIDEDADSHLLHMYFHAVLLNENPTLGEVPDEDSKLIADNDVAVNDLAVNDLAVNDLAPTARPTTAGERGATNSVVEVRWVSIYQVPEMRTRDGLAEFLSDQSIIDTVI